MTRNRYTDSLYSWFLINNMEVCPILYTNVVEIYESVCKDFKFLRVHFTQLFSDTEGVHQKTVSAVAFALADAV